MYALIYDNEVQDLSETNREIGGGGEYWVLIMPNHGEVSTGDLYNDVEDEFFSPYLAYAKHPDSEGFYEDFMVDTMDPMPDTHTDITRGDLNIWDDTLGYWVDDPVKVTAQLQEALDTKLKEIDTAAKQNINLRFSSSALGSVHSYDCRDEDQKNLPRRIAKLSRVAPTDENPIPTLGYLAMPSGSFFQLLQHNLDQLQQVEDDMDTHIESNRAIARAKSNLAVSGHASGSLASILAVDVSNWTL